MSTLADKQSEYYAALEGIYDFKEARNITQWAIEEVMKVQSIHLVMDRFLILTTHQEELLDKHLARLVEQEPIQYVLGYAEFFGLKFKVNQSVLIPRPETEELVEWILTEIQDPQSAILDIGTGSGCIPVSIKSKLPTVYADAIDISTDALAIARENAALNKVEVSFSQMDILHDIPAQRYDIIVSNPPYIGHEEKRVMSANVLQYEPHIALFADDPLIFYKRIAQIAPAILDTNGKIYLETSEYRTQEVAQIFEQAGYNTEIKKDYSGRERMIRAALK